MHKLFGTAADVIFCLILVRMFFFSASSIKSQNKLLSPELFLISVTLRRGFPATLNAEKDM